MYACNEIQGLRAQSARLYRAKLSEKQSGTHAGRSVADDEVRVAESVLVLCDQVLPRMNLHD